jgi:hypothetical protein
MFMERQREKETKCVFVWFNNAFQYLKLYNIDGRKRSWFIIYGIILAFGWNSSGKRENPVRTLGIRARNLNSRIGNRIFYNPDHQTTKRNSQRKGRKNSSVMHLPFLHKSQPNTHLQVFCRFFLHVVIYVAKPRQFTDYPEINTRPNIDNNQHTAQKRPANTSAQIMEPAILI